MESKKPQVLSRDEMHKIIERGESVMLPGGRICTSKEQLPSEGEMALATGDVERQAAAVEDLKGQIEKLKANLATLQEVPGGQSGNAADEPTKDPIKVPAPSDPTKANPQAQLAADAEAQKARERQALLSGQSEQAKPDDETEESKAQGQSQQSLLPDPNSGSGQAASTGKGGKNK